MALARWTAALAATAFAMTAAAQAQPLTPERVYADPDLNGPAARNVQLSPDGTLATFLKPGADDQNRLDLWAADSKGGAPFLLLDARKLGSAELSEAEKSRRERMRVSQHGIVEYHWDDEGKFILVPADGALYLAARDGTVRILRHDKAGDVDAKVSPKGNLVSYVREQNLYVLDVKSGKERALTHDGMGAISFATAEFAAQEEMGRFTGYWWSPDERHIALTHVDESGVDIIPRVEVGGDGVSVVPQRYPRAGRPNAKVELYVADVATAKRVKIDLGANPDIYLARVAWAKDAKTLYVQRLSRDQKSLDLLACDPASGACRIAVQQTSPHWVELSDDFVALKSGEFLWSSEASGNRHITLYAHDGKPLRQITSGDWPVDRIAGVNEAAGTVFFLASKDTPIESQLYRVSYIHPDVPQALTQGAGWWGATMARNGKTFIGSYSDPATPPQTGLYASDGTRIRWIEENRLDATHPYFPYAAARALPQFGTLNADDGTVLHYSLTKPKDFDPAKKYPVIVEVYGGPHVQTVKRDWGAMSDQLLSEAGYILFRLDNRGSFNRSVAFKTAIDRKLGTVETQDQLTGVRFLKSLPYVDAAHIGVSGWSYGGFMTLHMLTQEGADFAAGAAGAPPTEWSLYDTCYTERYMGTPGQNPDGYKASDILNRLGNLKGRVLLMKGLADDNVILANSTRLMAALQARSIPFDLMDYPGERHGIHGNAKRLQLMRVQLEFFARNLGGSALGE